jgi:repressor LexA
MYEDLTKKQIQILEFMINEQKHKGYHPSVREIGEAVNLKSPSSVHSQLEKLEAKGYIRKDPTKPRAIEIVRKSGYYNDFSDISPAGEIINVPVVGNITAGQPILAVENITEIFPLPVSFAKNNDCFILTVKGNSMIEAGIFNGDYIIVQKTSAALNGDIVVAMLEDDEATVKTFYKEKDHIRLQPENSAMEPIIADNVQILGKVSGVIRKL